MRIILALLTTNLLGLGAAQEVAREPFAESFTVDFGDFEAQAELSYPEGQTGPFPTVLLIHGSSPMDKDGSVFSFDAEGQPGLLSAIFKDIANFLNENGFAVVRYNKHYVTGPGQADFERFYSELDLPQMLADAEAVLARALTYPQVDAEQLYLYGWSEGSTVAAELATNREDLAGLIVQGPVVTGWLELFEAQLGEVGLPYLRSFAPDGRVTAEVLEQAQAGDGGLVAKGILSYLADPSVFETGQLAVSSFLDENQDGVIELESEFVGLGQAQTLGFLLSPMGFLNIYSEARALPTLLEQVDSLDLPVLILQGERDASTPAAGAQRLAEALEAADKDVTLHVYEGLGHALGETESVVKDNFEPIAEAPLRDLVAWLSVDTD